MSARSSNAEAVVTTRLSLADDAEAATIRRLASLDGGEPPEGAVMLAELDGEPVAAVGLADGRTVADPRADSAIVRWLQLRRLEVRIIATIWGV